MRNWTILSIFAWAAVASGQTPSFRGVGALPGGDYFSFAGAVSANGQVVVGASDGGLAETAVAFRWTAEQGLEPLSGFDGAALGGFAQEVSADGAFIVGITYPVQDAEAFRWSVDQGFMRLGFPNGFEHSTANGVSADGNVIVGQAGQTGSVTEAVKWTSTGGWQRIATGVSGSASDVSADGSVLVGSVLVDTQYRALRWTEAEGMRTLETGYASQAEVVSRWDRRGREHPSRRRSRRGTVARGWKHGWSRATTRRSPHDGSPRPFVGRIGCGGPSVDGSRPPGRVTGDHLG